MYMNARMQRSSKGYVLIFFPYNFLSRYMKEHDRHDRKTKTFILLIILFIINQFYLSCKTLKVITFKGTAWHENMKTS